LSWGPVVSANPPIRGWTGGSLNEGGLEEMPLQMPEAHQESAVALFR